MKMHRYRDTAEKNQKFYNNFILLLISLFIAVILGEFLLQIYYRYQHNQWLWEDSAFRVGYTEQVFDRRKYSLKPGHKDHHKAIYINDMGFREPFPDDFKRKKLIVCLGDSIPFGSGIKNNETYPAQLAVLLEASNKNLTAMNAGVPSYNLRQSFDRLKIDVIPLVSLSQIHLITFEAANDISLLTYYRDQWTPDVTWASTLFKGNKLNLSKYKKIAIFFYLSKVLDRDLQIELTQNRFHQKYFSENMLLHARQTLRENLALYDAKNIYIVLMPVNPFYYQSSNVNRNRMLKNYNEYQSYIMLWDEIIQRYNNLLQETAKEFKNVYFFDTRSLMDSQNRDEMYIDFIHHSPRGNKVLADALFQYLKDKKLL